MCFPVGPGSSDKRNIQAIDLGDFVDIYFGKNDLFTYTHCIVSSTIEAFIIYTSEIPDSR